MCMSVDAQGMISDIVAGEPGDAEVILTGPVLPGMPNCHSHAFQRQMAGLAGTVSLRGSDSFWTWREKMYHLANTLNAEAFEAIAFWLYVEMLEAGYTSCAEFHYFHHRRDGQPYQHIDETGNRILDAATRAGIAMTLLPTLYCRAGFEKSSVSSEQRRFFNDPERFLDIFESNLDRNVNHPLHKVGIGFHSLRAVSREQMNKVLAAEAGRAAAIHIHIAEQVAEVEQCFSAYGQRPVEWLLSNAPVDDRWCLVHATHMTPGEYDQAAARGVVAGLCPTTEADLGDGFFEAEYWYKKDGIFAVGSDSNLRISPIEELRLLEFGMRLRTGRRNVLATEALGCGSALYCAAAKGGGRALGQPVGSLADGFRADFIVLSETHPLLQGVSDSDILDRYVFAGDRGMIASVFVAGQQQVSHGSHPLREAAAAGFAAVMEEINQ